MPTTVSIAHDRARHDRARLLESVKDIFREHLYLPDTSCIDLTLAAYAANRLPGDPVWMLLVGASSSGKTEVLMTLDGRPNVHLAATVSEASLLSGSSTKDRPKRATGGILRTIGEFGILLMKDFTSTLSMNDDTKKKALAALREIYDGRWVRTVGSDGGQTLDWQGKMGLIGGVTQKIDSEHSLMASVGPRFLLYRMPVNDARQQARRVLDRKNVGLTAMRQDLHFAVSAFLDDIDFEQERPQLSQAEENILIELASFTVACRSNVERHPYTREIVSVDDSEGPGRLTRALQSLWLGFKLIGTPAVEQRELIARVVLDTVPPTRRMAIVHLARLGAVLPRKLSTGTSVGDMVKPKYPSLTIRRALEDLECHQVVESWKPNDAKKCWVISAEWQQACNLLGLLPLAPELKRIRKLP